MFKSVFALSFFLFKFDIEFELKNLGCLNFAVYKSKHLHKTREPQPSVIDQGHP